MSGFPIPPDESDTLLLLNRISDEDQAAWDELYRRYHDRLLFGIRSRLGPGLRRYLQSEDIMQSVALQAFKSLRNFEYRGPGSLNRYLQTLVLNKMRDLADGFGAAKRAGAVQLDPYSESQLPRSDQTESAEYYDTERYDHLERSLASLPNEMREILLLRKVDGLSSREVAEASGKSDAAVRKAYSRALARLTTLMTKP